MSYFDKLLSTIEIIYFAHGFNDVNDNIIRDTLLLVEKNKSKLINDHDFMSYVEWCMSSIIYSRLESTLTKEREVELFERLFNTVCKIIDEQ